MDNAGIGRWSYVVDLGKGQGPLQIWDWESSSFASLCRPHLLFLFLFFLFVFFFLFAVAGPASVSPIPPSATSNVVQNQKMAIRLDHAIPRGRKCDHGIPPRVFDLFSNCFQI